MFVGGVTAHATQALEGPRETAEWSKESDSPQQEITLSSQ